MSIPRFKKFRAAIVVTAMVFVSLAASMPAPALEPGDQSLRTVIKRTMYIDVREVEHILRLLDVKFAVKPDQNEIVIRGGRELDTALKLIDELDVPRPNFEVRLFVLGASKDETRSGEITEDLAAAVSHLGALFGYRSFELLDSVFLQVMEGRRGEIDGGVQLNGSSERTGYHFSFEKAHLVPEEGQRLKVRIDGLSFALNGTHQRPQGARLRTDVEILEGQKAAIGSSTPEGLGETLILIVEARIVKESPAG